METRQTTEVKIYKLFLNPIGSEPYIAQMVAMAYEKQKLVDWYNEQKADQAWEDTAGNGMSIVNEATNEPVPVKAVLKTFKKDSKIENHNEMQSETPDQYGNGIQDQWLREEKIDDLRKNNPTGIIILE